MSSSIQIPVQPPPSSTAKHRRTRYYAHRVKESFTSRVVKFICTIFLSILFVIGLVSFVLWLSLRPHRPRFHLVSFSLSTDYAAATFNATARNPNQNVDIYYDEMTATLFYRDQQIASTPPLTLPFHQPNKNTTSINGVFTAPTGEDWKNDLAAEGRIVLRLELTAGIRFKVARWMTRHHRMHASCDAGVGTDGQMVATYKNKKCSIYFN